MHDCIEANHKLPFLVMYQEVHTKNFLTGLQLRRENAPVSLPEAINHKEHIQDRMTLVGTPAGISVHPCQPHCVNSQPSGAVR